jgi:hypothetical protein
MKLMQTTMIEPIFVVFLDFVIKTRRIEEVVKALIVVNENLVALNSTHANQKEYSKHHNAKAEHVFVFVGPACSLFFFAFYLNVSFCGHIIKKAALTCLNLSRI